MKGSIFYWLQLIPKFNIVVFPQRISFGTRHFSCWNSSDVPKHFRSRSHKRFGLILIVVVINLKSFQTPYLLRLNYWEKYFKGVVISKYAEGNLKVIELVFVLLHKTNYAWLFQTITRRFENSVTEEVRATQKWWTDDYKEFDDRICSLEEEYDLMD